MDEKDALTEEQRIEFMQRIDAAEAAGDLETTDALFKELRRNIAFDAKLMARYARVAFMSGDKARGATITRRAVRLDPDDPEIRRQLADCYFDQGRSDDALNCYREVIQRAPEDVTAIRRAAHILQERPDGQDEALEMLNLCKELAPENPAIWLQLGAIYAVNRETYPIAEENFRKALELAPETPSALHNLGLLRRFQGDLETAEKYLLEACALHTEESDFAFSLGSCYYFMEKPDEALKWYDRAIEIDPENTAAHVYKAYTLLRHDRWEEGWPKYEARRKLDVLKEINYQRPQWDGSDLGGDTLLVICEQGMGDNLQFIRYAKMAAERNCRVVVYAHEALRRLYESLEGPSMVTFGIPEPKYFHRFISVMSLPYIFETTPDTVPQNVPYLRAPVDVIEKWGERLSAYEGLKVGICWRGNPSHVNDFFRSSSLEQYRQFLDVPGITFFSLHKGRPDFEQDLPEGLINIGDEFEDFADTAAAMEHLDLVISVDTSVCHLAGAVGRPVWTIIPKGPDFRWGVDGDTTPWYPTMKLYRQDVLGDWQPVLDRITADLKVMSDAS